MGKTSKHKYQSGSESEEDKHERKKSAKKVAKVAKMLGYSNDINPFGDANLLTPFVWGKKKEEQEESKKAHKKKKSKKNKHRRSSSSSSEDKESENEEDKRMELLQEIEKVRKRREDREKELAELERLREEEQRLREMAAFGDWQKKEEDFHLEQIQERSKLRLIEYRGRYIDRIVKNLLLVETAHKVLSTHRSYKSKHSQSNRVNLALHAQRDVDFLYQDVETSTAVEIVKEVRIVDTLEKLLHDIETYEELDQQKNQQKYEKFWQAVKIIINSQREYLEEEEKQRGSAMHASIVKEVKEMLILKSSSELDTLEEEIRNKITRQEVLDVAYWEALLDEIVHQRAVKNLKAFHHQLSDEAESLQHELEKEGILTSEERVIKQKEKEEAMAQKRGTKQQMASIDDLVVQEYLKEHADLDLDEDEDDPNARSAELSMGIKDEVSLPLVDQKYVEGDKLYSRKPRYFNRVRTGWDRTKYNLSHYDSDNPPPKVIQGYKFTIFYPDLLDKNTTPKYVLEPCADCDNNEFVIIRFTAGPPYEDIAFKILNKEWDRYPRAGFLRVFDRGVMQLNFNFKRVFYRR